MAKRAICAFLVSTLHLLFFGAAASAEPQSEDLFNLSFDQLLGLEVDLASNLGVSVKEQPATVSVLGQAEIESSSARYLMDLLLMQPGFWQGSDTLTTFSVGYRGVWGLEAKILLIIDGIEQNELAFGALILGERYPLSNIKRVEIIKGPGAVKYGGQAALAVIRVFSKDYRDRAQLNMSTSTDFDGVYQSVVSGNSGGISSSGVNYHMSASVGKGDVSNAHWRGLDGYELDLDSHSEARPVNFNLGLNTAAWKFVFQYDKLQQQDSVVFGDAGLFIPPFERLPAPNTLSFEHWAGKLSYLFPSSEKWKTRASLAYVQQSPWNSETPFDQRLIRKTKRLTADIGTVYQFSPRTNLSLGVSYFTEHEKIKASFLFDPDTRFNGDDSGNNQDHAVYSQLETLWQGWYFTLGGRFESHDAVGDSFVPRFSLSRHFGRWQHKWVFNKAFKIPQFDTFTSAQNTGTPIERTEETMSWEWELLFSQRAEQHFSLNLYYLDIKNYIGYDPSTFGNATLGSLSNVGAELGTRFNWHSLVLDASYSWFRVSNTDIDVIGIERDKEAVLGLPNHMLKLTASYSIGPDEGVFMDIKWGSKRYACVEDPGFFCGTPKALSPETLVNAHYRIERSEWQLKLGLDNLLNESVDYIQPYRGSQSPIPGLGRRLAIEFSLKF